MGYIKNVLQSVVFLFLAIALAYTSGQWEIAHGTVASDPNHNLLSENTPKAVASNWMLIDDAKGWSYLDDSPNVLQYFIDIPEITSELLSSGMFLSFCDLSSVAKEEAILSLPASHTLIDGHQITKLELNTRFVVGGVYLTTEAFTSSTSTTDNLDFFGEKGPIALKFSYIILPRTSDADLVLSALKRSSSYEDIRLAYALPK
ncbi:MAG: hypothetical protein RLZZ241_2539 [Bacteroidota bacterium]|jgi:hypothetical protein